MEIIGVVKMVGRVKDYGEETNFGRDWIPRYKYFLEVESKEHGTVKAMVTVDTEEVDNTEYGYKVHKDSQRAKPFVGDEIRITTHRFKNGWASVTLNQEFEITKENNDARKEREEWIAQKKAERKAEFQKKIDEGKQKELDRKLEALGYLETQKNDERLPEAVREHISSTFDIETIRSLLRLTVWLKGVKEGEGGKTAEYDSFGHIIEDGYEGTGLRRKIGPLYGKPESVRKSILKKAMESGLITENNGKYYATKLGIKTLVKIDTCDICNEIPKPYDETTHYATNRYARSYPLGIRFHCKHEIDKIMNAPSGCNVGTSIRKPKNMEKIFQEIMEDSK